MAQKKKIPNSKNPATIEVPEKSASAPVSPYSPQTKNQAEQTQPIKNQDTSVLTKGDSAATVVTETKPKDDIAIQINDPDNETPILDKNLVFFWGAVIVQVWYILRTGLSVYSIVVAIEAVAQNWGFACDLRLQNFLIALTVLTVLELVCNLVAIVVLPHHTGADYLTYNKHLRLTIAWWAMSFSTIVILAQAILVPIALSFLKNSPLSCVFTF